MNRSDALSLVDVIIVIVQVKTSLVHTSKFATLEVHNFHIESHKQQIYRVYRTNIVVYFQKGLALCGISIDFYESLSWKNWRCELG